MSEEGQALVPATPAAPAAPAAPDIGRANTARDARMEAMLRGDRDVAVRHDAEEREALGGARELAPVEGDTPTVGDVEDLAATMRAADGEAWADLLVDPDWDAPGTGGFEQGVTRARHLAADMAEFDPRLGEILENAQYPDAAGNWRPVAGHPSIVRVLARMAKRLERPQFNHDGKTMTSALNGEEQILNEATRVREQRNLAMRRGDRRLASQLDQKERDLYARLPGASELAVGTNIGHGGRPY